MAGGCVAHRVAPLSTMGSALRDEDPDAICRQVIAEVEYPDVSRCGLTNELDSLQPRLLSDGAPEEFREISLLDAVRLGLENAEVLRGLGGRVLQTPALISSVHDPSIAMSHPRFGEESSLASFDAQLDNTFNYSDGHRVFNNTASGGGAFEIDRDSFQWQTDLTKTGVAGTQFSLRQLTGYDHNNSPLNLLSHSWNGLWVASVRQPLLQGGGAFFNRVAGPRAVPDLTLSRGVVLARINGDIAVADFQRGVQNYVSELETAYWQLYFAYRSLDANQRGRDAARETWQSIKARHSAGLKGGEADDEAQAREQLYTFEQLVVSALNGTSSDGSPGVYIAERNLRRLLGLPITEPQLLRPSDEPPDVLVSFEWSGCLADALTRRVEIQQQMWRIRQRELELMAAKNFLLPRLDATASYSLEGFGENLIGGTAPFSSLAREVTSFGNDSVSVGLQLNSPLGFRREIAGVRHSELNLCRERALLRDQEHQVSLDLSNALAGIETTYRNIRLSETRLVAARQVAASRKAVFETGQGSIFELLDAQRRLADAEVSFHRARVAHSLGLANLHLQKGTILEYNGVVMSEADWIPYAHVRLNTELNRWREAPIDYRIRDPQVSLGPFDSSLDRTGTLPGGADASTTQRLPRVETGIVPAVEPLEPGGLEAAPGLDDQPPPDSRA
jgi:outer membrane protein TolC